MVISLYVFSKQRTLSKYNFHQSKLVDMEYNSYQVHAILKQLITKILMRLLQTGSDILKETIHTIYIERGLTKRILRKCQSLCEYYYYKNHKNERKVMLCYS